MSALMTKPDTDLDATSRGGTVDDSGPELPFESPELGTRGFFPNSSADGTDE